MSLTAIGFPIDGIDGLLTQWAAVRIKEFEIRLPPHKATINPYPPDTSSEKMTSPIKEVRGV